MTRALAIAAAMMALSGCSFINDWGSLTTDPNARRDGGGIDSGMMDGGVTDGGEPDEDGGPDEDAGPEEDAGAGCVDTCTPGDGVCTDPTFCGVGADGCTLCVECAECDACPDTCVFEPGACFCDGELRPEGSSCVSDGECVAGLGCLGGICHRICEDPGQPEACEGVSIYPHCVYFPESASTYCVDELCDPLSPEPLECLSVGFERCVLVAGGGLSCDRVGDNVLHQPCGAASECGFGLSCLEFAGADGVPRSLCAELCDAEGSAVCSEFGSCQTVDIPLSDGVVLGVCVPGDGDGDGFSPPYDCDDTKAESYPGAFESCGDGDDSDCDGNDCPAGCGADADCAAAEACALEGQCRARGEEGSGCFPDGTCSGGLDCEPSSFRCFFSCFFDFDCTSNGATYSRCDTSFCRYRRSGESCTSGAECESGTCDAGACP